MDTVVRERAGDDELAVLLWAHVRRARALSERLIALQREGRIGSHASWVGREASVVGTVLACQPDDWLFPSPRDGYAAVARGMPLPTYLHHVFGTASDPSLGHATPDHAPARAWRVVPPSGVPGAHVAMAVGAAWAAKIRGDRARTVALFDRAVFDSGDFHNALNFAGVFRLPTVLVARAGADDDPAERAVAYGLASAVAAAGDVRSVHAAVAASLARAAAGHGATLVYVRADGTDPLASAGAEVDLAFARQLDEAVAEAAAAPPPAPGTLFEHVYAEPTWNLRQQRALLGGGKGG